MENIPNGYIILKDVAEKLLSNKTVLSTLSFPAKRVLYAGRASGKWYTKSKQVHDEIMNLYKSMDRSKKKSDTGTGKPDPEMVKKTIQDLDRILKVLASYGK